MDVLTPYMVKNLNVFYKLFLKILNEPPLKCHLNAK